MNKKLKVTEIFESLQGESIRTGLPTTFVRLAGCNLDCRWCDSPHAARGEGRPMAAADIMRRVETLHNRFVCITGGEPLLQKSSLCLIEALRESGAEISVETNGSLDISVIPQHVCRVMDVKCPSSGHCGSALTSNLSCLTENDNLKFVIAHRTDFDWAMDFIFEHNLQNRCPIFFSPVTSLAEAKGMHNTADLYINARQMAQWILQAGIPVRLQLQLHKILWPERMNGV